MASTGEAERTLWLLRRALVLVLLTALVVAGLSLYVQASQRADARAAVARRCELIAHRTVPTFDHGDQVVAVIGDSYTAGDGLAEASQIWAARFAEASSAAVIADGIGGSGFTELAHNPCRVPFQSRTGRALSAGPELVILEGGLNDVDYSDDLISAGVHEAVTGLPGVRVVIVGPTAAPDRLAGARRVDRVLAAAAAQAGAQYVSTFGWQLPFLSDGVHLTPAGHRTFGRLVADAVAR